jgi:hypothetical protein
VKVLFDIGHPAHVHLYRNLIWELNRRGKEVYVTVRNIKSAIRLLDIYRIEYTVIGGKHDSLFSKLVSQIIYDLRVFKIIKKNGIKIGIGSSIVLSHMSLFSSFSSVILDDDDDSVERLFSWFAHPFATLLLSPDALRGNRKQKGTIFYPGYHELTYLHPGRFTPDARVLKQAGLNIGDTFFILRFNAFKAYHDQGIKGISLAQKLILIEKLLKHGKVLITTEREIESELKPFHLNVAPDKIHSLMSFATLFIGDSQTMTSEAAVLGTPALRMNSFAGRISYLEEEERTYHLTYGYRPDQFDKMMSKIDELLAFQDLKKEWLCRRDYMLKEKTDITGFLLQIINEFPKSIERLKKLPDYYKFINREVE